MFHSAVQNINEDCIQNFLALKKIQDIAVA